MDATAATTVVTTRIILPSLVTSYTKRDEMNLSSLIMAIDNYNNNINELITRGK
jgi:hypothetical protein